MITLELSEAETAALLLLVKLGMDTYSCATTPPEVIETLCRVPNPVIDGVIAKVSRAGTAATKEGSNGRTVPC